MAGDNKYPVLGATPFVISALKKASSAGISSKEGHVLSDDIYKEEVEVEETNIQKTTEEGNVLVKVLSKVNDLWYNVEVYPQGINGASSLKYQARLFFGDKCWVTEIPVNTYLIASKLSVNSVTEEEEEEEENE